MVLNGSCDDMFSFFLVTKAVANDSSIVAFSPTRSEKRYVEVLSLVIELVPDGLHAKVCQLDDHDHGY